MIIETMNKKQLKALVLVLQHSLTEIYEHAECIRHGQESAGCEASHPFLDTIFEAASLIGRRNES